MQGERGCTVNLFVTLTNAECHSDQHLRLILVILVVYIFYYFYPGCVHRGPQGRK
jgi:hypothetical protein